MSEENRNRDTNREETPGRQKIDERDESQNKSGIDKAIDKAQEKGIFDKAAKFAKDKFGSGGSKRR